MFGVLKMHLNKYLIEKFGYIGGIYLILQKVQAEP